MVALLLAQVPLPVPWNPSGKAATIANVTGSEQVVAVSEGFAGASLVVVALGALATVTLTMHRRSPPHRVLAIIVVTGAPVLAWLLAVRSLH